MTEQAFFPSRWAKVGIAAGVVVALSGAGQVLANMAGEGSLLRAVLGALIVACGLLHARQAAKMGVYVSGTGIRCRSGLLGANGSWSWNEVERAEVYFEPSLNNPPREVVAVTTSGDMVRLGRIDGRTELVDQLRARVPVVDLPR